MRVHCLPQRGHFGPMNVGQLYLHQWQTLSNILRMVKYPQNLDPMPYQQSDSLTLTPFFAFLEVFELITCGIETYF